MKAHIEKVSKFGVLINGDWKNLSKFHKGVSLDGISSGDDVEIEIEKDKYITSIVRLGGSAPAADAASSEQGPAQQGHSGKSFQQGAFRTSDEIIRQEAFNAVFGSPWLGEFYKAMDYSEALSSALALVDKAVEVVKGVR